MLTAAATKSCSNANAATTDGDTERLRPLARELMALAPDAIFAPEPSSARAVRTVAPNLPIVCSNLGDHLHDLFASCARPSSSVTGIAINVVGVSAKLVELAHDATERVAVVTAGGRTLPALTSL